MWRTIILIALASVYLVGCFASAPSEEASGSNRNSVANATPSNTLPTPPKQIASPSQNSVATAPSPTPSIPPAVPSEETIKRDLVGQQFFYKYRMGEGGQRWTVRPNEVRNLRIINRFTDSKTGTDEVNVFATISNGQKTIEGALVLSYKRYEQGWRLERVQAKDEAEALKQQYIPNFSLEK